MKYLLIILSLFSLSPAYAVKCEWWQTKYSATSEVTYGSIILYDKFLKNGSKPSDLVHESGHHLFKKISLTDEDEFATLSGWREEVTKDRKVYILPPANLIRSDSYLNKEEDFTNHLEIFYEDPKLYKQKHPTIFEFLQKRYPL